MSTSAATPEFVHLHVHSEYSLEDGLLHVDALVQQVAALGMGALALTEQDNLYSAVKFYRAARQHGVKPIVGVELRHAVPGAGACSVVLLCQHAGGYRNLCRLLARAHRERGRDGPRIDKAWLQADTAGGLIALSGGPRGEVGRCLLKQDINAAQAALDDWMERFPGRYYLEVQRTGRAGEDEYIECLVPLATAAGAPLAATNDARFARQDDFEAHEARVCIHAGDRLDDDKRERRYTDQQYLRTPAEMHELFSDLPEALANSVAVARRCNLELELDRHRLPEFTPPGGLDQQQYIVAQSEAGLRKRLGLEPAQEFPQDYRQRLDDELRTIGAMGFAGYFLIVADFVHWARDQGIPVGPGRGSGGGSLVAYVLGITELDPLEHGLLFERFLNPERVSLPDFDIDFCMLRRDEVLEYAMHKFGRDRVAQIVTFGSMNARAVVRDCGRVLGHPHGMIDALAKLIPPDLDMTLDKALQSEPELKSRYRGEEEVRVLIDLARRLEGTVRHAGRHAGGTVIAPGPLLDFLPLAYFSDHGGEPVTQYDMNDLQHVGLVKFDFLGLKTLTVIAGAEQLINATRPPDEQLRIDSLALDDPQVYKLIRSGRTSAIFQLESAGMKALIADLQPDCFQDLVALLALFRPGPLGANMLDVFCAAKHGRKPVDYVVDQLRPILEETHGVILYQEQVMEIARRLAGYSMGGADLLRRAMGKKNEQEMAKHRCIFVEHAGKQDINGTRANRIFDLMEKFGKYGFNKSHSTAYALLSYRTAWLKAHYPAEFMAASLSSEMDHIDRLNVLCEQLAELGLRLLPPSVNHSRYAFTVATAGQIRYGLGAVRGLGRQAMEALVAEREQGGPYEGLYDLCRRLQVSSRQPLEALVQCGALDEFGIGRAALMASLEGVLRRTGQALSEASSGQLQLFAAPAVDGREDEHYQDAEPWDADEILRREKQVLGRYLSGHPYERYREELAPLISCDLAAAADESLGSRSLRCAGMVEKVENRSFGRRRVFEVSLHDGTGRLVLRLDPDKYTAYRDQLRRGAIVHASVEWVPGSGGSGRLWLEVRSLTGLQQLRNRRASLRLRVDAATGKTLLDRHLPALVAENGSGSPMIVEYRNNRARAELRLDTRWRTEITDALLEQLSRELGKHNVRVEYDDTGPGGA